MKRSRPQQGGKQDKSGKEFHEISHPQLVTELYHLARFFTTGIDVSPAKSSFETKKRLAAIFEPIPQGAEPFPSGLKPIFSEEVDGTLKSLRKNSRKQIPRGLKPARNEINNDLDA